VTRPAAGTSAIAAIVVARSPAFIVEVMGVSIGFGRLGYQRTVTAKVWQFLNVLFD
jgi:hypothetical protein